MIPTMIQNPSGEAAIVTYSNISKVTNSADAIKTILNSSNGRNSGTNADGYKFYIFLCAAGGETELSVNTKSGTTRGIYDLYVDNVLHTAGLDDYAASAADVNRQFVLSPALAAGNHTIKLQVNGKNALSTAYNLYVQGVSIQ